LADADKPKDGESESDVLSRLIKRDQEDEVWRKEIRMTDEKFGLVLGSLVS
jgi:hypothetical protein